MVDSIRDICSSSFLFSAIFVFRLSHNDDSVFSSSFLSDIFGGNRMTVWPVTVLWMCLLERGTEREGEIAVTSEKTPFTLIFVPRIV